MIGLGGMSHLQAGVLVVAVCVIALCYLLGLFGRWGGRPPGP